MGDDTALAQVCGLFPSAAVSGVDSLNVEEGQRYWSFVGFHLSLDAYHVRRQQRLEHISPAKLALAA